MKLSKQTKLIIALLALDLILFIFFFGIALLEPTIIGQVISKVYVFGEEINQTCSLDLLEGWNLISIACKPANNSPASMLQSIEQNYTSIHTYNTSESLDYWKAYKPDLPSWVVSDLDIIIDEKGYWIKVTNNSFLSTTGSITSPKSLALPIGWNLIGYPTDTARTPADAFSTIANRYSIVWTFNTSASSFIYYDPNLATGPLTIITPGEGYWMNMTQSGTIWLT